MADSTREEKLDALRTMKAARVVMSSVPHTIAREDTRLLGIAIADLEDEPWPDPRAK